MKIVKTVINILTILSLIIIIFVLIYFYQILIQNKKYGTLFGYSMFKIVSGSMEPTIKVGNRIISKETNNVNEGDIVVYLSEDTIICHRVTKIENQNVICKGDNNNIEDSVISKNDIIGKVIHIF